MENTGIWPSAVESTGSLKVCPVCGDHLCVRNYKIEDSFYSDWPRVFQLIKDFKMRIMQIENCDGEVAFQKAQKLPVVQNAIKEYEREKLVKPYICSIGHEFILVVKKTL
jgi:hypothetical protein